MTRGNRTGRIATRVDPVPEDRLETPDDRGPSGNREDRPRSGGNRPFERPKFERNQGTEETSPATSPERAEPEPRLSESPNRRRRHGRTSPTIPPPDLPNEGGS